MFYLVKLAKFWITLAISVKALEVLSLGYSGKGIFEKISSQGLI